MGSEHIKVELTNPLPLELLLSDGNTTKFPQAVVRNVTTGATVAGSPFNLTHVADGLYRNTSFTPTTSENFRAVFIVYEDAGHTTESVEYPRTTDNFNVSSILDVWNQDIDDITVADSIGQFILNKLLTIKKFLALNE